MQAPRQRLLRIFLLVILGVAAITAAYAITNVRRSLPTEPVQLALCGEPLSLPYETLSEDFISKNSGEIARGEPIPVCDIFCFDTGADQSVDIKREAFRLCLLPANDQWLSNAFSLERGDVNLQTETGKPESLVRRAFDGIETIGLTKEEGSPFSHSVYVAGTDENFDSYHALCSFTAEVDDSPLCEIQFQALLRKTKFFVQVTIVGPSEVIENWSIETTRALDRLARSTTSQ